MPAVMIAGVLSFGLLTKNQVYKKNSFRLSLLLILFFGNYGIVNWIYVKWESEPIEFTKIGNFDNGIVLSGVTNHDKEPHDRVYFHKGADRVLHTVQLYKLGKIKRIIITGGSGRVTGEKFSEAVDMKKVFLMCGVPDSVLFIETQSRNTRENALFTKRLMDSLNIEGSNLLITSAFHMPRSKSCFDKVGVGTTIFPVDYYGGNTTKTPDVWIVPNETSYKLWHIMIHEWIGYVMYKVMGYA